MSADQDIKNPSDKEFYFYIHFPIVNFQFLISNIPLLPLYSVYIILFILYDSAGFHHMHLIHMVELLTQKYPVQTSAKGLLSITKNHMTFHRPAWSSDLEFNDCGIFSVILNGGMH